MGDNARQEPPKRGAHLGLPLSTMAGSLSNPGAKSPSFKKSPLHHGGELRSGSKWRVAKKVLNLMDSNRASSEKQDMADIIKMFQRFNARKIFENWEPDRELRDIPCDLHTVNATQNFRDLDARSSLSRHRYDSVEVGDDVSSDLEKQRHSYKGQLERMDSQHIFADIDSTSLTNIDRDTKFTRTDSQKAVGDVDTSSLFNDLSLRW